MSLVLVVDKGGMPKDWCNFEMAACYYAKNKVLWELGEKMKTMLGGHNERGEQSRIDISCIIEFRAALLSITDLPVNFAILALARFKNLPFG